MFEFATQLQELTPTTKAFYLYTEPEVLDFTAVKEAKLCVCTPKVKITQSFTLKDLPLLISLLKFTVFSNNALVLFWDAKQFASYVLYWLKKRLPFTCIDLKVMEAFCNIQKNKPENLLDAIDRMKHLSKNNLYKSLHEPLIFQVVPSMETTGLLNIETRCSQYPYYEIEGQQNGRFNSTKKFNRSFLAHTLSEDDKGCLKPKNNQVFVYADFKNCEIKALQYLSKDPRLQKIINSNFDVYRAIYEEITNDKCNSDKKRDLSKNIILPVIYGCGASRLSEITQLSEGVCKILIQKLKVIFKVAFDWLKDRQTDAESGPVKDMFGRVRDFTKQPYKARDFHVQGLAATICQEKLIDLHNGLTTGNICFTIHDSYGLVCPLQNLEETIRSTKRILETDSKLCNGLAFKSDIKFGETLLKLEPFKEADANYMSGVPNQ